MTGSSAWSAQAVREALGAFRLPSTGYRVDTLDGYPHLVVVSRGAGKTVLKQVQQDSTWTEALYAASEPLDCVIKPLVTEVGHRVVRAGELLLVALPWLPETPATSVTGEAAWWGRALARLHTLRPTGLPHRRSPAVTTSQPEGSMTQTDHGPADGRRGSPGTALSCDENVLCHGDPSPGNARDGRLIDLDRSGPAPREYDAQRLLWQMAIHHDLDGPHLATFWSTFEHSYRTASDTRLNLGLVLDLYATDVDVTLDWLASRGASRHAPDAPRQATLHRALNDVVRERLLERALTARRGPE